jgi:LPS-assembly protein
MRRWPGAFASLLLAAWAVPAFAADPLAGSFLSRDRWNSGVALGAPVILDADTLTYEEDTGVAIAEGNVELGFGNRSIRADRIRYDTRTGEAEMTGHVHYKDLGDEFSFDRIVLNIDTELGVLYNGTIRLSSNNYQISSDMFEKTGARKYRVLKGSITTCPCDPEPDWKFDVRRAEVSIDGYAVAKDVTFKVRGVPVFWLPWAAFPVKVARQSGFLFPGFSHTASKGYSFQLPYYWAISRWSDATVTLEEMSRRGFRPEVEYRYVLNPSSEGAAHFTAHRDAKTGGDRFRVYGKNIYRNDEGWTANAKWDFASEDQYYVDLVEADILRTGRHVPSRGFVGRGAGQNYLALSAVLVKDVQNVPDDNTVQRLPEASAVFLPRPIWKGGVEAGGELDATYFYRKGGDREIRGRGAALLSRTFPLYPAVSFTPFLFVDLLGSTPASDGNESRSGGRVLPGGGGHLEADFRRTYGTDDGKRLVHLVQSDLTFRWVPKVGQDRIPLTDQWSRIGEQRQFVFAVTQRLLRVDNVTGPSELAFLAIEWALDVGNRTPSGSPYLDPLSPFARSLRDQIDIAAGKITRKRDAASDLFARFQYRLTPKWNLSGETLMDTGDGTFTLAAIGTEWKRDQDTRALLEYRISRDLSEDIQGRFAFRPVKFLGLRANTNYSIKSGRLTEGSGTVTLYPRSDCWSVGLVALRKTNPNETGFKVLFSLKGIGSQTE